MSFNYEKGDYLLTDRGRNLVVNITTIFCNISVFFHPVNTLYLRVFCNCHHKRGLFSCAMLKGLFYNGKVFSSQ